MTRRELLLFGGMLLLFCVVLGSAMSLMVRNSRILPLENQVILGSLSSRIDSVAVMLLENNRMIIQIQVRMDDVIPTASEP